MKTPLFLFLLLATQQIFGDYIDTTYYDTITFETSYAYLVIDTSDECIWQIARPNKTYLNTAFSGDKVIITDSIHSYPANNYSYFDLKIGEFNCPYYYFSYCIEFNHKFDTDTLFDGGYITISHDNGETWTNVFQDESNYYDYGSPYLAFHEDSIDFGIDTLINGELGFSGRSTDWLNTKLEWIATLVYPDKDYTYIEDTIILRFNFISDNNESGKEGWMIDDITIYSIIFAIGGSVRDFGDNDLIKLYPNPTGSYIIIELNQTYQDIQVEFINLQGEILTNSQFYKSDHIQLQNDSQLEGLYFLRITLNHKTVIVKRVLLSK